jgi:DNA-directed RNA polymerase specialized sigma24 family protein
MIDEFSKIMTEDEQQKFAQLLEQVKAGDADACKRVMAKIYPELRLIVQRIIGPESTDNGLSRGGSALANELYVCRLGTDATIYELAKAKDYLDILRIARRDMKQLLMDFVRACDVKKRLARGDYQAPPEKAAFVEGRDIFSGMFSPPVKDAMETLEEIKPDAAYAIELRFVLGLTFEDGAAAIGLGDGAFREALAYGKAWLRNYLGGTPSVRQ